MLYKSLHSYLSRVIFLGLRPLSLKFFLSLDFNNWVNNDKKSSYLPLENVWKVPLGDVFQDGRHCRLKETIFNKSPSSWLFLKFPGSEKLFLALFFWFVVNLTLNSMLNVFFKTENEVFRHQQYQRSSFFYYINSVPMMVIYKLFYF